MRICARCGKTCPNDTLVACPSCMGELVDPSNNDLRKFVQTEARKAAQDEWRRVRKWGILILSLLGVVPLVAMWQAYTAVTKQVSARLDAEFNEPRIKELVREAAEQRAQTIIQTSVEPAIARFMTDFNDLTAEAKRELQQELAAFSSKMVQLSEKRDTLLGNLALIGTYTTTVVNAQAGYRKDYDRLHEWAEDKLFLFSPQAAIWWNNISSQHNPRQWETGWPYEGWYDRADPSALELPQLVAYYELQAGLSPRKPMIIDYIWRREDFCVYDIMAFYIKVIEQDDSLDAVEYAGRYFGVLAGIRPRPHPLAVDAYVKWWTEKKDTLDKKSTKRASPPP